MKSLSNFLSLRKNFDALLFAYAGWYTTYIFTRHGGIGLSPDSIVYIITAKNLFTKGAITACSAAPMTDFPAFYPIFLSSIIFITRQAPVVFGPMLNGLLFASVIYLSGCIIQRFLTPSRIYKNIILLCMLCSPTLIEVYNMLWSETLFIFLLLLFFISFKYYLQSYRLLPLLITSLIAAMACDTRYAGITILGTGGMILLFDKRLQWKKKTIHIGIFLLIGISFLAINIIRNNIEGGFLTGRREKGITPLMVNIKYYGSVLCDWLPFFNGNYVLAATVAIIVFIIAWIFFIKHFFDKTVYSSFENIGVCYFITYSVFIIASATITHYETLNSRLLSPMYIPFLWTVTYPLATFIERRKRFIKWTLLTASIVLAYFFVNNEILQSQDLYEDASENGIPGFTDDSWKNSPIDIYLSTHKNIFGQPAVLYSNSIEAVCFYSGNNCNALPHYVFKEEIDEYHDESPHYLIWFNNIDDNGLFHLPEISKCKKMTLLKSFPDGAIYWCENNKDAGNITAK
jgi:hypothetical protein